MGDRLSATALLMSALLVAACANSPQPAVSSPPPTSSQQAWTTFTFEPSNFVTKIDNQFLPMKPGSRWVYRETDAQGVVKDVEVTVTDQVRMILGVRATVVHDLVKQKGTVTEDTYDWYAQDRFGNVWYLGEDTTKYEGGKTSKEGSWEAGVDGAKPGVVVPAAPAVGMRFRQEHYKGHAEDWVEILALDVQAQVPFGTFDRCLKTKDTNPLKHLVEVKIFCPNVGHVETTTLSGGTDHEVLVQYTPGS